MKYSTYVCTCLLRGHSFAASAAASLSCASCNWNIGTFICNLNQLTFCVLSVFDELQLTRHYNNSLWPPSFPITGLPPTSRYGGGGDKLTRRFSKSQYRSTCSNEWELTSRGERPGTSFAQLDTPNKATVTKYLRISYYCTRAGCFAYK